MPRSRIEPGDGRVITSITIQIGTLTSINRELVADTGAPWTIIPSSDVSPYFSTGQVMVGPIIQTNFGKIIKISGVKVEVEVEDFGGGNHQTKQSKSAYAHFHTGHGPFLSAYGLLGMDVFDDVEADPVKTTLGNEGYLARRV